MNNNLLKNNSIKNIIDFEKYGSLLTLILIFIISSLASPYFLQVRNILNILRQISYTGIIALGMTFVIISGGIDLSVGSMTALVGGVCIGAINYLGSGYFAIFLAFLVAVVAGIAFGAVNGFTISKGKTAPFIVTLGTMAIYRSLILYFTNASEVESKNRLFTEIGSGSLLGIPIPVLVFLVLVVLFYFLLNYTAFGRHVCAIGANEEVARFAAIKVDIIKAFTYMITGFTVAVSSTLLAARLNSITASNTASGYELDAIAAVIIGGTSMSGGSGTIIGTVIGAFILGIINNMLTMMGVSPYLQGTVKGLVIIGAVMIQRKR